MYIGSLNEKIGNITFSCKKKDRSAAPTITENGNPFYGEKFWIKWKEMDSNGIDLFVSLPEKVTVDRLVIRLGEKCFPNGISVYTAGKAKKLDSHLAETGKSILDREISLAVEETLSEFVLEFDTDFSGVVIRNMELFGTLQNDERAVFPTPSHVHLKEGSLKLDSPWRMVGEGEDAAFAADLFRSHLEERAMAPRSDKELTLRLTLDPSVLKNAYRLTVSEEGIDLIASDRRGLIQGVETVFKLAQKDTLPFAEIADDPFCEMRGVHLYLPSLKQMDFTKRLIRDYLVPLGYNFIIMELAGAMQYESHPEINDAWLLAKKNGDAGIWPPFPHGSVAEGTVVPKNAIRELVDFIRSYGMDVVPEVQSLGHVQFMTLAHPDIAEKAAEETAEKAVDERLADIPPSSFYNHSFCPSNPKSYEILFDLMDEIIEVFRPREYVHMGHDEVYQIGICPICKNRHPSDILAEDLNRLHGYLAKRGLKMMIWADMLQPCTKYQTYLAIDKIPKDILLLDFIWYFHLGEDIETNLVNKDFDVIFGNLYSSHFPRYESRIRGNRIRGGQISMWARTEEAGIAREGKFYDMMYTAQMLWSDSYTAHCRAAYDRVISAWIPELREKIQNVRYPSRVENSKETLFFAKKAFEPTVEDAELHLEPGDCFASLIFEHSSAKFMRRIAWAKFEVIGHYRICYADGSEEIIPITYGGNICHWDRKQNEPFKAEYYRHNGYCGTWYTDGKRLETAEGKKGTVYRYEWINPKPDVAIESIDFAPIKDERIGITVHSVSGIQLQK